MKIINGVLVKVSEADIIDGELVIPSEVVEIGKHACAQIFELERVVIPKNVTKIDDGAFIECVNLSDVCFEGDALEYLGNSAFRECSNLAQVDLPNIQKIGAYVFEKCDALTFATFHSPDIGSNCFLDCGNLIQVNIENGNANIKENAFKNCSGLVYIDATNGVTELGENAFENCTSLLELNINSQAVVAPQALKNSNVKSLQISDLNVQLNFDYRLKSIAVDSESVSCEIGEDNYVKQVYYVDIQNNDLNNASSLNSSSAWEVGQAQIKPFSSTYVLDFDKLNFQIKDFSTAYKSIGLKSVVNWLKFIASAQNIPPNQVRLPQAEVLLTLDTPAEMREFLNNIGKYNKLSGKYRNLNIYDRAQVLKLCKLLGAFENDEKQFVQCANCLGKDLPAFIKQMSGKELQTYNEAEFLIADWFKRIDYPDKYNAKCAKFFMNYYKELLVDNKTELLAIAVNNFEDFSKAINVVTPEKIEQVLVNDMANNVPPNRKELAQLMALQGFVGKDKFEKLSQILTQAEQVYPNIYDSVQNVKSKRFDRQSATKLVDKTDANFQYEWLNKASPYNLLIGNICGCCARLGREGEDIMYKSATHSDVQTMAIKRRDGEFIGKATVYLNRDEAYAVFNNIELNRNFLSRAKNETLNEVLNAFLRGTNAFVTAYNSHAEKPLKAVTVGADRNKLYAQLCARFPQSAKLYTSIEYENYKKGGDSAKQQFIVYDATKVVEHNPQTEIKELN